MYKYLCLFLCLFGFISAKAQITFPDIDVQHYRFAIQLNDANDTIKGQAKVRIKFLKDVNTFKLNLVKKSGGSSNIGERTSVKAEKTEKDNDGKGMLVSAVTEEGKDVPFTQDSDVISINTDAKTGSIHSYTVVYQGVPADGLIISTNKFGHRTFFGDNWPNRAHNWLPCADYPADKAQVDFIVTAPDHYQVVANGLKIEETVLPNHFKQTHWKETAQLPTKVMVIGVADFAVDHVGDVGNVPVYTYVFPESKDAGFKSYAVAKEILPFFIKNVGPFAYEKLANVQSKTIFGGMENASAIFYFENSVTSAGIEELMAHEIAHQWFGDAASEKSFGHVWLSEGFATFMTNAYLENKYGIDTLKKRLIADRNTVFAFEKKRHTPIVDTAVKDNFMQLLNDNSYQKGGWVLHMLHKKLGDELFWKGIRAYFAKYNGGNANTNDLRVIMEQAGGQNLEQFFEQWLYTPGHPQLNISWKYDAGKGMVDISIEQKQAAIFDFPLEVTIDGQLHTIAVKAKTTNVQFAAKVKPGAIKIDPNVNALVSYEMN